MEFLIEERARKARNEYARKYRREHPERIREIQTRYWTRKAEKMEAEATLEKEGNADE